MKEIRFNVGLNTPPKQIYANVAGSCERGLPFVEVAEETQEGPLAIVGGGPSLARTVSCFADFKQAGGKVASLNGAHNYLLERLVIPDFHIQMDARPQNASFVAAPCTKTRYLIASQCAPAVFDALDGYDTAIWHSAMSDVSRLLNTARDASPEEKGDIHVLGGGQTVGLRALSLAFMLGFRRLHLFGFDSSYENKAGHAYQQGLNDKDKMMEVVAFGRPFLTAPWMAEQAQSFPQQAALMAQQGCEIFVHGDGLLPWVAGHAITNQQEQGNHVSATG